MTESPPTNRVAELRIAANMSQSALAQAIGTSDVTVWRWEKGKMKISETALRELCRVFDRSAEHVLGWDREAA